MKSRRGFTLIEVILGLSIFSLVAMAVYSIFSSGIKLSEKAKSESEIFREARWTLELMAKDLENMVAYDFAGSYPERAPFTGSHQKIDFIIPTPKGLRHVGYYLKSAPETKIHQVLVGDRHARNVRVDIEQEEGQAPQYLVREEQDFVDYLNNKSALEEDIEVMATHVKTDGLRFFYSFLEGSEESQNYVYKEDWGQDYLPLHVRMEIDFYQQDKKITQLIPLRREVLIPIGYLGGQEKQDEST